MREHTSSDFKRASKLLATLALIVVVLSYAFATPVNAGLKPPPPFPVNSPVGITNNILEAWVETATLGPGVGTYTICTGPAHTNPGQDVFYDGVAHSPWSTYNSIHVVDTLRDYVTTTSAPAPDLGFTLVGLDNQPWLVTIFTPTRIVIQWTTIENLLVEQDIEVIGTTIADTFVRVTMTVTNKDEILHMVGIRYQWDIMIDGFDGSWIRPWDATPGGWLSVETPWTPPPFQYWETTNDPAAPVFSVLGSIMRPPVAPPPTPPDTFMLAAWGSAPAPGLYDFAYSFTPTGRTVAGPGLDSAVAYYWNPVELAPGAIRSVTAYVWCLYVTAAAPPPVGGYVVAISKLELLTPWIGLIGLVGAVTAAVATIRRRKS